MPRLRKPSPEEDVAVPKPWGITQADIDSITKLEEVWGTTRLLPPENEIPEEFRGPYRGQYKDNIYVKLVDALFCGSDLPKADVVFREDIQSDNEGRKKVHKCTMAHIRSFEPAHEYKIAGIAWMIAQVMTLTETKEN